MQKRRDKEKERDGVVRKQSSQLFVEWEEAKEETRTREEPGARSCQHGHPLGRWQCLLCALLSDGTGMCAADEAEAVREYLPLHLLSLLPPTL